MIPYPVCLLYASIVDGMSLTQILISKTEFFLKRLSLQPLTFFDFFYLLFKSFVKVEFSYVFVINLFTLAENCMEK